MQQTGKKRWKARESERERESDTSLAASSVVGGVGRCKLRAACAGGDGIGCDTHQRASALYKKPAYARGRRRGETQPWRPKTPPSPHPPYGEAGPLRADGRLCAPKSPICAACRCFQ